MRDRLIEILKEILPTRGMANGIPIIQKWDYEATADYLLANGVIVPPCKVGDTLYGIRNLSKLPPIYSFTAPDLVWIIENADLFGKEIFPTQEEAEKALAERSNDN